MTASENLRIVHLTYHHEDGSWWADSEEFPGLFAGGDSLDDAKALAWQAVRDELGEDVAVFDWMPVPGELEPIVASKKGEGARKAAIRGWDGLDPAPMAEWFSPSEPRLV